MQRNRVWGQRTQRAEHLLLEFKGVSEHSGHSLKEMCTEHLYLYKDLNNILRWPSIDQMISELITESD